MNWQPIETAPENTNVLIYGNNWRGNAFVTGGIKDEYGWWVLGCDGYDCGTGMEPTHWALPEPPKEGE